MPSSDLFSLLGASVLLNCFPLHVLLQVRAAHWTSCPTKQLDTPQSDFLTSLLILQTQSECLLPEFELKFVFYAAGVETVLKALHFRH